MISRAIARLRGMVEFVTDVRFDDNGVATSKGGGDHELESAVGWHFGFYSKPNDGGNGVVLKADGQGNTSFLIAYRDKQYEMSLQKGEVGAKNAFDAYWLLNDDGVLELNGTDYAAPKWDDWLKYFDAFLVKLKVDLAAGGGSTTSTDALAVAVPAGLSSAKVKNG